MKKYKADPNFKHPLTNIVLEAFEGKPWHDEITIACYLAGVTSLGIKNSKKDGISAYKIVAKDVLGCMLKAGIFKRNEEGWYMLSESVAQESR